MARDLAVNIRVVGANEGKRALGEVDRAIGGVEKTGAAATKGVENFSGGLQRSRAVLGLAAGAAAGLAVVLGQKLITALKNTVLEGARLAAVEASFRSLTAAAGETGDAFLGAVKEGSRGLIDNFSAMEAANKALLLGLPVTADEMGTLASTATALGRAMGLDANTALDDLITALGRSSPLILDNLGLTVKLGEANDAYAAQLGKSATQLTDAEKKTAFYNAAMEAARLKVAEMGGVQLTLGDHLAIVNATWTDFTNALQVGIARSPVLTTLLGRLSQAFIAVFGERQQQTIDVVVGLIEDLAIGIVRTARFFVDAANMIIRAMAGISTSTSNAFHTTIEWLDSVGLATEGMKRARDQAIENARALVEYNQSLDQASAFLVSLEEDLKAAKDQQDVVIESTRTATAAIGISADEGLSGALTTATEKTQTWTEGLYGLDQQLYANVISVKNMGESLELSLAPKLQAIIGLTDEMSDNFVAELSEASDVVKMFGESAMETARQAVEDKTVGSGSGGGPSMKGAFEAMQGAIGSVLSDLGGEFLNFNNGALNDLVQYFVAAFASILKEARGFTRLFGNILSGLSGGGFSLGGAAAGNLPGAMSIGGGAAGGGIGAGAIIGGIGAGIAIAAPVAGLFGAWPAGVTLSGPNPNLSPEDIAAIEHQHGRGNRFDPITGEERFARGGLVTGRRMGVDSVRALLMPGEGVINTTGMSLLGVKGLGRLNNGQPPTGPVFNITIHAESHEGGRSAADAFLQEMRLRGIALRT